MSITHRATLPATYTSPCQLVIFDFDGTLFDTHDSISHCIKLAFNTLQPSRPPPDAFYQKLISSGTGLHDTFRALMETQTEEFGAIKVSAGDDRDGRTIDDIEDEFTKAYRTLYATEGQPLIRAYPGAAEVLSTLREALDVPVAIVTNKGVAAVRTALDNNDLGSAVPPKLIIGDNTPGAERKPNTGSFTNVLMPALKSETHRHDLKEELNPAKVLVVGDTVADIQFASNIGAKAVWCRYGYGDKAMCERLQPAFTVDSLSEVISIVKGLR